eukprot:766572-Hanusia_phi.AAC.3
MRVGMLELLGGSVGTHLAPGGHIPRVVVPEERALGAGLRKDPVDGLLYPVDKAAAWVLDGLKLETRGGRGELDALQVIRQRDEGRIDPGLGDVAVVIRQHRALHVEERLVNGPLIVEALPDREMTGVERLVVPDAVVDIILDLVEHGGADAVAPHHVEVERLHLGAGKLGHLLPLAAPDVNPGRVVVTGDTVTAVRGLGAEEEGELLDLLPDPFLDHVLRDPGVRLHVVDKGVDDRPPGRTAAAEGAGLRAARVDARDAIGIRHLELPTCFFLPVVLHCGQHPLGTRGPEVGTRDVLLHAEDLRRDERIGPLDELVLTQQVQRLLPDRRHPSFDVFIELAGVEGVADAMIVGDGDLVRRPPGPDVVGKHAVVVDPVVGDALLEQDARIGVAGWAREHLAAVDLRDGGRGAVQVRPLVHEVVATLGVELQQVILEADVVVAPIVQHRVEAVLDRLRDEVQVQVAADPVPMRLQVLLVGKVHHLLRPYVPHLVDVVAPAAREDGGHVDPLVRQPVLRVLLQLRHTGLEARAGVLGGGKAVQVAVHAHRHHLHQLLIRVGVEDVLRLAVGPDDLQNPRAPEGHVVDPLHPPVLDDPMRPVRTRAPSQVVGRQVRELAVLLVQHLDHIHHPVQRADGIRQDRVDAVDGGLHGDEAEGREQVVQHLRDAADQVILAVPIADVLRVLRHQLAKAHPGDLRRCVPLLRAADAELEVAQGVDVHDGEEAVGSAGDGLLRRDGEVEREHQQLREHVGHGRRGQRHAGVEAVIRGLQGGAGGVHLLLRLHHDPVDRAHQDPDRVRDDVLGLAHGREEDLVGEGDLDLVLDLPGAGVHHQLHHVGHHQVRVLDEEKVCLQHLLHQLPHGTERALEVDRGADALGNGALGRRVAHPLQLHVTPAAGAILDATGADQGDVHGVGGAGGLLSHPFCRSKVEPDVRDPVVLGQGAAGEQHRQAVQALHSCGVGVAGLRELLGPADGDIVLAHPDRNAGRLVLDPDVRGDGALVGCRRVRLHVEAVQVVTPRPGACHDGVAVVPGDGDDVPAQLSRTDQVVALQGTEDVLPGAAVAQAVRHRLEVGRKGELQRVEGDQGTDLCRLLDRRAAHGLQHVHLPRPLDEDAARVVRGEDEDVVNHVHGHGALGRGLEDGAGEHAVGDDLQRVLEGDQHEVALAPAVQQLLGKEEHPVDVPGPVFARGNNVADPGQAVDVCDRRALVDADPGVSRDAVPPELSLQVRVHPGHHEAAVGLLEAGHHVDGAVAEPPAPAELDERHDLKGRPVPSLQNVLLREEHALVGDRGLCGEGQVLPAPRNELQLRLEGLHLIQAPAPAGLCRAAHEEVVGRVRDNRYHVVAGVVVGAGAALWVYHEEQVVDAGADGAECLAELRRQRVDGLGQVIVRHLDHEVAGCLLAAEALLHHHVEQRLVVVGRLGVAGVLDVLPEGRALRRPADTVQDRVVDEEDRQEVQQHLDGRRAAPAGVTDHGGQGVGVAPDHREAVAHVVDRADQDLVDVLGEVVDDDEESHLDRLPVPQLDDVVDDEVLQESKEDLEAARQAQEHHGVLPEPGGQGEGQPVAAARELLPGIHLLHGPVHPRRRPGVLLGADLAHAGQDAARGDEEPRAALAKDAMGQLEDLNEAVRQQEGGARPGCKGGVDVEDVLAAVQKEAVLVRHRHAVRDPAPVARAEDRGEDEDGHPRRRLRQHRAQLRESPLVRAELAGRQEALRLHVEEHLRARPCLGRGVDKVDLVAEASRPRLGEPGEDVDAPHVRLQHRHRHVVLVDVLQRHDAHVEHRPAVQRVGVQGEGVEVPGGDLVPPIRAQLEGVEHPDGDLPEGAGGLDLEPGNPVLAVLEVALVDPQIGIGGIENPPFGHSAGVVFARIGLEGILYSDGLLLRLIKVAGEADVGPRDVLRQRHELIRHHVVPEDPVHLDDVARVVDGVGGGVGGQDHVPGHHKGLVPHQDHPEPVDVLVQGDGLVGDDILVDPAVDHAARHTAHGGVPDLARDRAVEHVVGHHDPEGVGGGAGGAVAGEIVDILQLPGHLAQRDPAVPLDELDTLLPVGGVVQHDPLVRRPRQMKPEAVGVAACPCEARETKRINNAAAQAPGDHVDNGVRLHLLGQVDDPGVVGDGGVPGRLGVDGADPGLRPP